jgi:hypothetical protein
MGHPWSLLGNLETLLVLGVDDGNRGSEICSIRHKRTSVRGKVEMNEMVAALRKFQIATGRPQEIRPQLSIFGSSGEELFTRCLVIATEEVGLAIGVVHEPDNGEGYRDRLVRRTEGGAMGLLVVNVEEGGANNNPYNRRISTSLTRAVDRV